MLWIVQKDVHAKNPHYDLVEVLERLSIPFLLVDVYHHDIDQTIDNNLPIITNGSIMLSQIAVNKGWSPGSLFNDNFSYKKWSKYYQSFLLNRDAVVSTLKEATVSSDFVFARPILDNKIFNGQVFSKEDFLSFQQKSIAGDKSFPRSDIEILLSPPKKIGQEHRHYIVDGEIVSSSRYKFSGTPNFKEGCDDHILEVVQHAISLWQPARAFVMDTYISGNEVGIVEIGCICHAGMYHADLMKIVSALDNIQYNVENSLSIVTKPKI